jgi:hypothetical protein
LLFAAALAVLTLIAATADQVQMQNGDQYCGKVQSLGPDTLVLQSDVLGTMRLPRAKVASIILGTNPPAKVLATLPAKTTPPAPAAPPSLTNTAPAISSSLRDLGTNSGLIQQVQAQFLAGAGPEAKAKFDELMGGLTSGKLDMNALRAEAKATADQVRAMRKDLGEGAGWTVDAYLAILDRFLNETAPPAGAVTNHPGRGSPPKPQSP